MQGAGAIAADWNVFESQEHQAIFMESASDYLSESRLNKIMERSAIIPTDKCGALHGPVQARSVRAPIGAREARAG